MALFKGTAAINTDWMIITAQNRHEAMGFSGVGSVGVSVGDGLGRCVGSGVLGVVREVESLMTHSSVLQRVI